MRLLRTLAGGLVVAASLGVVAFTTIDRLDHLAPPRATRADPSTTGTILPGGPALRTPASRPAQAPRESAKEAKVASKAPAIPNGFDTERLNALMRGDPIAPIRR